MEYKSTCDSLALIYRVFTALLVIRDSSYRECRNRILNLCS